MKTNTKYDWLPVTLAFLLLHSACSDGNPKDEGAANTDESDSASESSESSEDSDSTPQLVPLDEQPGHGELPYASCPFDDQLEEQCGRDDGQCFAIDDPTRAQSVCRPPCAEDNSCPAPEGSKGACSAAYRVCYLICTDDSQCPEGMFCGNELGEPHWCVWPTKFVERR